MVYKKQGAFAIHLSMYPSKPFKLHFNNASWPTVIIILLLLIDNMTWKPQPQKYLPTVGTSYTRFWCIQQLMDSSLLQMPWSSKKLYQIKMNWIEIVPHRSKDWKRNTWRYYTDYCGFIIIVVISKAKRLCNGTFHQGKLTLDLLIQV